MNPFRLNDDRYFDPDPQVRSLARDLYERVKNLPIVSPHGHVDPALFVHNSPFPNPTELFITPDHYLFRMLYSQGISMESLGVPKKDGSRAETDARRIWQLFADNYFLFAGTPSQAWLQYELYVVLGVPDPLTGGTAQRVFDYISEVLQTPAFRPRALYDRFRIEMLATTDAATDTLDHHKTLRRDIWKNGVVPTFRPDGVTNLLDPNWKKNIALLGKRVGKEIRTFAAFVKALEERREFFKKIGAKATDHGILSPYTHRLTTAQASALFSKALKGKATPKDAAAFTGHMLMEMARMSVEDGLVMQIHPGADRNHNAAVYHVYGPDKGADIPIGTEYTNNLRELLNAYGNDPRFSVVVFTLDESAYSRELAPLAGHYPAMKLGPPWWFHDSINGMRHFRERITETAGFYNTVGFIDDTRAFLSIPARHDLSRRVDANILANLVVRHILTRTEAEQIGSDLAYNLVRKAYRIDTKGIS
ncbi:MAG TPA: glucuronate isomerase [Bacteroidetes bacterium]|nr:glucuronate isomerase [Bacteroidota bacterium]